MIEITSLSRQAACLLARLSGVVTGFEPLQVNFSNAVMARDFGRKGLSFRRLPANSSCAPVL